MSEEVKRVKVYIRFGDDVEGDCQLCTQFTHGVNSLVMKDTVIIWNFYHVVY